VSTLSSIGRLARGGALAVSLFGACAGASAQITYTYVEAEGLSGATAVNRFGAVAGSSDISFGVFHAALWDNSRFTDLGTIFDSPFASSAAFGINDAGSVVGFSSADRDENHAALFVNGKAIDLGTGFASPSFSVAYDINNRGEIVGTRSTSQSATKQAFLLRNERFIDLGSLGGTGGGDFSVTSEAYAINNKGLIVGTSLPAQGAALHAFLWEKGRMRDLGTLGGNNESTSAHDINDRNVVVGSSPDERGRVRAFLWRDGTMSGLGTLGGRRSDALGINNRGQVVGRSDFRGAPFSNAGHAVLWDNGRIIDLNTVVVNLPGDVALETAEAINDDGVIVGTTCSLFCEPGKNSPQRAFILVPNRADLEQ
jgi:probable HAF family extracellular repeat protein